MTAREHAVVTGGASGIGLGVVRRLLDRDAAVTVLDADTQALGRLGDELPEGASVHAVQADVTHEDAVERAFDEAHERHGVVNRLVTCAGIRGELKPALELDVARFRRVIDVHVLGTLLTARSFASRLPADSGRPASMVAIGSIVGLRGGWTGQADYGTAKVAVGGLAQVLAVEWAPRGIRVNVVAPGMTRTPMVESLVQDGYDLSYPETRTPMGRLAEVNEVAEAIEFLLFDATYVTGVVLPVDGGWTASGR